MSATRHRGCLGIVKIKDLAASGSAAQIFGVESWEFTTTNEREEASEIGSCQKTYVPGASETTGVLNLWWDSAATANQGDVSIANDVNLEIYPSGDSSGKTYYKAPTGGALINEIQRNGSTKGAVGLRFNFSVAGEMTTTSVP